MPPESVTVVCVTLATRTRWPWTAEATPDGPVVVAVVCDGVSSSAAARRGVAGGRAGGAAGPGGRGAGGRGSAPRPRWPRWPLRASRWRPCRAPGATPRRPRSCPRSRAADEVTLCWLGDSRAYWLDQPASESRLLTRDDSVAGGMVTAGLADEAAAMASPHAHVLTRWLGGDAADLADDPDRAAHVERYTPPGPGALLICSDGLWNYLPEAVGPRRAGAAQGAEPTRSAPPPRHGEVRHQRRRRRQHHCVFSSTSRGWAAA